MWCKNSTCFYIKCICLKNQHVSRQISEIAMIRFDGVQNISRMPKTCKSACFPYLSPSVKYEGHSRINDNEFISRKVLSYSVLFIVPHGDTDMTYSCLKFGAFIMARIDSMIIGIRH